ncbi:hypothetical protein [Rhodococcus sp. MTM3W5.2]|uniref:hypothetical protein n=1 Tax=Rhodococcus sp. MTM3W5.2 TaxID=1805827 RepID=UPI0011AE9404|nr:hypothetical protein [Rhodococcus sp. MTM3W5.2]
MLAIVLFAATGCGEDPTGLSSNRMELGAEYLHSPSGYCTVGERQTHSAPWEVRPSIGTGTEFEREGDRAEPFRLGQFFIECRIFDERAPDPEPAPSDDQRRSGGIVPGAHG